MDETFDNIMVTLARIENNQVEFYIKMMRMIEILQENIAKQ